MLICNVLRGKLVQLQLGDDHKSNSYNYTYMLNEIMILTDFTFSIQHNVNPYRAKTLCDLHVHPTNQMQDLQQCLDKFMLGGQRPDYNMLVIV
jgi:hypothetical protein